MTFNQTSTTKKACGLALTVATISNPIITNNISNNNVITMKKEVENKPSMVSNYEIKKEWLESSSTMQVNKNTDKIIPAKDLIEEKLDNTSYDWRTKKGLAKDTKIPIEILSKTLENMAKQGDIYIGIKKDGTKIYTLVKNYKKNTKLTIKIKDLLIGKIIR